MYSTVEDASANGLSSQNLKLRCEITVFQDRTEKQNQAVELQPLTTDPSETEDAGKTQAPKVIQGKSKGKKLTNVRMIPHILHSPIHQILHQKLCHGLVVALKPCRFPIVPLLILIPRWVNLPQRRANNAAIGLIHQLHPHVA